MPSGKGNRCCGDASDPNQKGTSQTKATSTAPVVVESGGNQVAIAAHAGLHALGSFADRLGLGNVISKAITSTTRRLSRHARGKVMVHLFLLLAGGGESCAGIEHLRAQRLLFPDVCSDSTLYRSARQLSPEVLAAAEEAVTQIRARVWRRMPSVWRNEEVLDFDASLVEIHSENKERTGPTYEVSFGPAISAPTRPRTTCSSWTRPSPPCPRCSKVAITAMTIPK